MATANPPPGALPVDAYHGSDPFVTGAHDAHRQRYAAFDNSQFSIYLNGSPAQAKRALQAHLAETTRRLQETSNLGNALVQQRKELESNLQQVDQQLQNEEVGPELRQRLAELEKEFNDVGRETARAFLPKSRVPSGETDSGVGASVYSSEAQHSPTKVSVPSRKQRNQQPSRINDIALATEISTSLLGQLKDLQAVLLERDEALKAADLDRSQLEIEVEGLSQRLRTLDESESRLKDVNWNLETQVRESEAQFKSAADKESRLNHALNLARTEKSTIEREFEDLKQQFTKLSDDHINKAKQNETELTSLRRNVTMTEMEKSALQRKVEDLSNQNQELAKAMAYRMNADEQAVAEDMSPDDGTEERETQTPEHSPPPSPSKATPRHGMLESETLKHSLAHAHRMIQQLKNNVHREKTEKFELKRMLQDARDELETNRGGLNGPGSAGKRRKTDKDVFKKPARPDRLGALRSGTQEILDDEDWEEQEGVQSTPSRRPRQVDHVPGAFSSGFTSAAETSATEGFETANETSDAAFETANERDGTTTETDAFLTGAETLDGGSSDELTETEAGTSQVTTRASRSSLVTKAHRDSYESTASTSGDEFDEPALRTPLQHQNSRFRLKTRPGSSRRATPKGSLDFLADTPPAARDSPASFASTSRNNTPAQSKSLFAELEDLSGDEDDGSIADGTPSRSSVLFSPESSPEAPRRSLLGQSSLEAEPIKATMVDSGTMTEAEPVPKISLSSIHSKDTQPQVTQPVAFGMSSFSVKDTSPQAPRLDLRVSPVSAQETAPQLVAPPKFIISNVSGQSTTPQAQPIIPLAFSSLSSNESAPRSTPSPDLQVSSMSTQHTAPQAAPSVPLDISSISGHHTEPRQVAIPPLGISQFVSHQTQPLEPATKAAVPASLDHSSIVHQSSEPREAITPSKSASALLVSGIHSQATEPQDVAQSQSSLSREVLTSSMPISEEPPRQTPLQMSNLSAHSTEPVVPRPQLSAYSSMSSQATAPSNAKPVVSQFSPLFSHATEPVAPRLQPLQHSTVESWSLEPIEPRQAALHMSTLASQATEPVEVPKASPSQLSAVIHQSSEPREVPIPALSVSSTVSAQASEPIEVPKPEQPKLSMLSSLATEPVAPRQQTLRHANIAAQHTEPLEPIAPMQSLHHVSNVTTVHDAQPESPTLPAFLPTPSRPSTAQRIPPLELSFSGINMQETEPSVPSRPVTAHRAVPVPLSTNKDISASVERSEPGFFDSVLPWSKNQDVLGQADSTLAKDGRVPLGAISSNVPSKRPVSEQGTQTMVSAQQIDKLLLARNPRYSGTIATGAVEKAMSPPPSPSRRHSNEGRVPRRPGSSGSIRSRAASPPPLPSDHKEVIAAAAKSLPLSPAGVMGPPTMPASAYKKRPTTPSIRNASGVATIKTTGTTVRPRRHSQRGDARSGASSPISRRSSLSSFTSEVDQRFNMQGGPSFAPNGMPAGATDPRMIQAITQTMIGEYLWKYTRKAGREGLSENRHRRFFWIHPYTRTLYWSDRDPQSAGKEEMKGKSVAIETVQEVEDNNTSPPGLHQKSLIIGTPGRSIKVTAPTGQRHETWLNALRYLCQRVDDSADQQVEKPAASDEIQDEFNAGYRSSSRATGRSKASMASYVSRRTSSPHHQIPTLRQSTVSQQRAVSTEPGSVSSRISSFIRPTSAMRGSFSSRRSRSSVQDVTTPEEPGSTNTDLSRDVAEQIERDIDNMVNVRACCDGKDICAVLLRN